MKFSVKNYSTNKCDDAYFGLLSYVNNGWEWDSINCIYYAAFFANGAKNGKHSPKSCCIPPLEGCKECANGSSSDIKDLPIICIVLESPHRNEFDSSCNPIGPAMGATGRNIADHFPDALNCSKQPSICSFLSNNQKNKILVYLMNSIQYQCSMGISPISHVLKESNWIDCWYSNNAGKTDFETRVKNFQDAFFINACTQGCYVPLKTIVGDLIKSISAKQYCESPHPSCWTATKVKKGLFK